MTSPISLAPAGKKQIWLAANMSGRQGSLGLAVVEDGHLKSSQSLSWDDKSAHSEVATLKLEELLKSSNCEFADISQLIVNVGPGSFTGLRVGMSLVRTMAYALNLPVLCVNTLELLAFMNAGKGENVFVAIKAIQNFFYGASFEIREREVLQTSAPRSLDREEIRGLAAGYTKVLVEGESQDFETLILARHLIEFAVLGEVTTRLFLWNDVKPLYIRGSEAEEKMRRGLLKPL